MNEPLIRPTRTSEIGPLKGMSETANAADAAKPANASGISSPSAETNRIFTNVSAWKSSGNNGRKARSTNRQTKISASEALPSLRVKPPGNLPLAAYLSLYSTCSGIKSVPGFASCAEQTVANNIVFPIRTITEPSACFANLPVSMVICLPSPKSIVLIIGFTINFKSLSFFIFFRLKSRKDKTKFAVSDRLCV